MIFVLFNEQIRLTIKERKKSKLILYVITIKVEGQESDEMDWNGAVSASLVARCRYLQGRLFLVQRLWLRRHPLAL